MLGGRERGCWWMLVRLFENPEGIPSQEWRFLIFCYYPILLFGLFNEDGNILDCIKLDD
jgi:hypothetical protein